MVGVVRAILYYTITSYVGTSVLYVLISYTLLLVAGIEVGKLLASGKEFLLVESGHAQ